MTTRPRRARSRVAAGECGQVVPLLALVLLVAVSGALLLGRLAVATNDAARARTSADAAALAGASGGRAAAETVANQNGAVLVGWMSGGETGGVVVTVAVGGATATAAAEPTAACIDARGATVLC